MAKVNPYYSELQGSYLFSEIAKRMGRYSQSNPNADIIKLGIGDVTQPLPPLAVSGMIEAVEEMGQSGTFQGYGPENGYAFLRNVICKNYEDQGVRISLDEVFISTGSKEDTGAIQELFSQDSIIAVPDPVYPVYVDTNVMAGRAGEFINGRYSNLVYLEATAENNFKPALPKQKVDVIYLCNPNNPTGQALNYKELTQWVEYALENEAIILYDGAYEAFITENGVPHSIYEIIDAKNCAIEFRSFSKMAGFTGTRCAYVVIPEKCLIKDQHGDQISLNKMWSRRQSTRTNGVAYFIQKGAKALFSKTGQAQCQKLINYYLENAHMIRGAIDNLGIKASGGINAPYVWFPVPAGFNSWSFFDHLLHECQIVGTPGAGFGKCGEGYFRLSAFGNQENTRMALKRLQKLNF